jgi:hypothetical protein
MHYFSHISKYADACAYCSKIDAAPAAYVVGFFQMSMGDMPMPIMKSVCSKCRPRADRNERIP